MSNVFKLKMPVLMAPLQSVTICAHDAAEHHMFWSTARRAWDIRNACNINAASPTKTYPNFIAALSALERLSGVCSNSFTFLGE